MRKVIIYLLPFFLAIAASNCGKKNNSINITVDGIYSLNFRPITQFSISKFKMDHYNLNDIRPINHEEIGRFCCDLKERHQGATFVLFNMADTNYRWNLCKLDTSFIAIDTFRTLSLEEKVRYLQTGANGIVDSSAQQRLPFVVEAGYVYQLFGVRELNGSLYFCLNDKNKLMVQFVDKGPW